MGRVSARLHAGRKAVAFVLAVLIAGFPAMVGSATTVPALKYNYDPHAFSVPQMVALPQSATAASNLAKMLKPPMPTFPTTSAPPLAMPMSLHSRPRTSLMQTSTHVTLQAPRVVPLVRPVDPLRAPRDPAAMGRTPLRSERVPLLIGSSRTLSAASLSLARRPSAIRTRMLALSANLGGFVANAATVEMSGAKAWFSFASRSLPGTGAYAVNTTSGNLMLTVTDGSYAAPGVGLTLARTYNSILGQEEEAGSLPHSLFGAGWSSSLDAHLVSNTGNQYGQGITFFDPSGARWDYLPDGAGNWVAPAGQHALLAWNPNAGPYGAYELTYPGGIVYRLYSPTLGTTQPQSAGLAGRMMAIFGRNSNNSLSWSYAAPGCPSSCNYSNFNNFTGMTIAQSDGKSLYVTFKAGAAGPLVGTFEGPDQTNPTTYTYDSTDELIEVDHPGDNASSYIPEVYTAASGRTTEYFSPRLTLASRNSQTPDGAAILFQYNGNSGNNTSAISEIDDFGNVNPSFGSGAYNDEGVNSGAFQGGYATGLNTTTPFRETWVTYKTTPANNGWSFVCDSNVHCLAWYPDSQYRAVETSTYTGTTWIASAVVYDTDNNVVSAVDPRGNETDFAFDPTLRNGRPTGNLIAVARPAVAAYNGATSLGTFRPTSYTTYDAHNNVTASCDPMWSNVHGQNWNTAPTSSPCAAGVVRPGADTAS